MSKVTIHHPDKPGARYATKGSKFRSLPKFPRSADFPIEWCIKLLRHRIRELNRKWTQRR